MSHWVENVKLGVGGSSWHLYWTISSVFCPTLLKYQTCFRPGASTSQPLSHEEPQLTVCPGLPAGLWLRAQPCFGYWGLLFLSGESVEWASGNSTQTSHPWPRSVCSSQRGKWAEHQPSLNNHFTINSKKELAEQGRLLLSAPSTP